MKLISILSLKFFPTLQNKEEYFQKITEEDEIAKRRLSILGKNQEQQNRCKEKDPEAGRFAPSGSFEEANEW